MLKLYLLSARSEMDITRRFGRRNGGLSGRNAQESDPERSRRGDGVERPASRRERVTESRDSNI